MITILGLSCGRPQATRSARMARPHFIQLAHLTTSPPNFDLGSDLTVTNPHAPNEIEIVRKG